MKTVDVGVLLDAGHWSGYQKFLVGVTALTIVVDGFDNQLLAISILPLMREWDVPRAAFASILASGMIGMMAGGAIGGYVGDRVGRRVALLASVASFGVLTALVAVVDTPFTLGVLRFLTGIGLGGAMPNSAALASEYVPKRHRPFAVTLTIMCIPAMLAWTGGLINAVQTTMYALAAHVYPTGIRATGVGTTVAVGRMGGVLSTYAGSWALESGGASRLFVLLAVTMTIVFVALASVGRHIPRHADFGRLVKE